MGFEDLKGYQGPSTSGFSDLRGYQNPNEEPDKVPTFAEKAGQFIKNIGTDTVETAQNFANNVSNSFSNMNKASATMTQNGKYIDTAHGPVLVPTKEDAHNYNQAVNEFAESVKTPVFAAALTGNPIAGALALPYMAHDLQQSYQEGGAGQVARDFTYGPIADMASQPDIGQQIYDRPVSSAIDAVMAVAPIAIPVVHGVKAIRSNPRIGEGFADLKDNIKERFQSNSEGTGFADLKDYAPTVETTPIAESGNLSRDIYNRLREKGYTDAEAAGIVGNYGGESNFSTTIRSNDGNNSVGMGQWTGPRETQLYEFAQKNGLDPHDWRTQVDFTDWELKNTESAALAKMRENPNATPEEQAYIVRKYFERPDESVARDEVRQKYARDVFDGNYGNLERKPSTDAFRPQDKVRTQEEPFVQKTVDFSDTANKDLDFNVVTKEAVNLAEEPRFTPKEMDISSAIKDTPRETAKATADVVAELKKGVTDPLGESTSIDFSVDTLRSLDSLSEALIEQQGHKALPLNKTSTNAEIIKQAITNPDIVVKNESGKKTYVADVSMPNGTANRVSVSVEPNKVTTISHAVDVKPYEPVKGDVVQYLKTDNIANNGRNYMANRVSDIAMDSARERIVDHTPVSRKQILDTIDKEFTKIHTGRVGKSGVNGWYSPTMDTVRTRSYGDFGTIAHELGHYVDNKAKLSQSTAFDGELVSAVKRRFGNAYDNLPIEGIRGEGIAEFFHDFTTNDTRAKAEFPRYYKAFNDVLNSDHVLAKKVGKLKTQLHAWNEQPAWERAKGQISFADDKGPIRRATEKGQDLSKNVYKYTVDDLDPLKKVVTEAEKMLGHKIETENSPYDLARLTRGSAGIAKTIIDYGDPKKGIPSLREALSKIPQKEHKDFSAFLVAMRDLDILKWNKSVDGKNAVIAKELRDIAAKRKEIETSKSMSYNEKNKAIHELESSKPEYVEKIYTDKSQQDILTTVAHYGKREYFKKAQSDIVKYQANLLNMLVDGGLLKESAIKEMQSKYPNYVPFYRELGESGIQAMAQSKSFMNIATPVKRMRGSSMDIKNPLESIIKNTFTVVDSVERNNVGKAMAKFSDIKGFGNIVEKLSPEQGTAKAMDSTFSVWENGEKTVYATTPEVYDVMKGLNKDTSNFVVDILAKPASTLRAGATSLSPEFVFRNLTRDTYEAAVFSKNGFIPVVDTIKGIALWLDKSGRTYQEYMRNGAAQSSIMSMDRNYLARQIKELTGTSKLQKYSPIDLWQSLGEAIEASTRLAEYHNSHIKGYTGVINRFNPFGERKPVTAREGALIAREITVDFSRSGSHTRSLNRIDSFFNAAVQGTDKIYRAFKDDPKGMAFKSFMYITLPSIFLWNINKDNPAYQELPQWQKDAFWLVPAGDIFLRIPKPPGIGYLFGTATERFLQYVYDGATNKKGNGLKDMAFGLLDNLTPPLGITAITPIYEWATNHSLFLDRDIVPQSKMNLPDHLQYGPNTTGTARAIGEAFNLSPYKIDNTIRGYGAGAAGLITTGIDAMSGLSKMRPSKKWTEQPIIRGFTANPYASSDSVQRVYDGSAEQEKLLNEAKLTGKLPSDFDAKQYGQLKNAKDALSRVNEAQRAIMESKTLDSDAKRQRLDELNMIEVNIARRGLGLEKVK